MTSSPTTLQLAIGPALISFAVAPDDLSLRALGRVAMAAPIQYVWPHPSRDLLYVASSNRAVSKADDVHSLATVEVDRAGGALRVIGQTALPTRPIHLTVAPDGRRVLVTYNAPSKLTLHPIGADGIAGAALPQTPALDTGIYPHQILVMPSGASAVLVARGNDARAGVAEEPGSLRVLGLEGDALTPGQIVAPGGGLGFGPRHLDFHPGGRWVAASIERQNELHLYALDGDRLSAEPVHRLSTWPAPARSPHDQLAGTLHFHPNGKFLYLVNRNDTAVYGDGREASDYEGNNIAVYAFDEASGRPELLQHVRTDSVHVRTFSLDRSGSLLVAASILPALARRANGTVVQIPARLSFFRVAADGTLTLARTEDMGHGRASLFWSRLDTLERQPA